jgi:hypothetical protein
MAFHRRQVTQSIVGGGCSGADKRLWDNPLLISEVRSRLAREDCLPWAGARKCATMAPKSEDDLEKAFATNAISEQARAAAVRSLAAAQKTDSAIEVNEDMIKLACALKAVKGEGCRITAKLLNSWKGKVVKTAMLKQNFWAVLKSKKPNLIEDPHVAQYVIDPDTIAEWPSHVPKDGFWIVDQVVPRTSLGPGVMEVELAVGMHHSMSSAEGAHAASSGSSPSVPLQLEDAGSALPLQLSSGHDSPWANQPRAATGNGAAASTAATPIAQSPETATREARVLREHPSDSEKTDEQIAEQIARNSKEAFDAKKFWCSDPNVPSTVEFWVRTYKDYILKLTAGTETNSLLPPHMQVYLKYVVKELLHADAFSVLDHFTPILSEIESSRPELLPPLGKALIRLVNFDLQATKNIDVEFLDMSQKNTFFRSAMYKSFLVARWEARLESAKKSVDAPDTARRSIVEQLLEQLPDSSPHKESLEFAKALFGPMLGPEKVHYLVEEPSRFAFLEAWAPSDERLCLRHFSGKDHHHQTVPWPAFLCGAKLLAIEETCIEGIHHPVLKGLVKDYKRMRDVVGDLGDAWRNFVDLLFLEVCSAKLGVQCTEDVECPEFSAEHAQVAQSLSDILGPKSRKLCETRNGMGALIKFLQDMKPEQPQRIPEKRKESASASSFVEPPVDDGQEGAPASPGAATPQEEVAAGNTRPPANKCEDIAVGDVVVLSVCKHKEAYNKRKAKVLKVLSQKYRLELLEGPSRGEERDFLKAACAKELEVVANVPLAGAKRSLDGPEPNEDSVKRGKSTELAASLFGELSDM